MRDRFEQSVAAAAWRAWGSWQQVPAIWPGDSLTPPKPLPGEEEGVSQEAWLAVLARRRVDHVATATGSVDIAVRAESLSGLILQDIDMLPPEPVQLGKLAKEMPRLENPRPPDPLLGEGWITARARDMDEGARYRVTTTPVYFVGPVTVERGGRLRLRERLRGINLINISFGGLSMERPLDRAAIDSVTYQVTAKAESRDKAFVLLDHLLSELGTLSVDIEVGEEVRVADGHTALRVSVTR